MKKLIFILLLALEIPSYAGKGMDVDELKSTLLRFPQVIIVKAKISKISTLALFTQEGRHAGSDFKKAEYATVHDGIFCVDLDVSETLYSQEDLTLDSISGTWNEIAYYAEGKIHFSDCPHLSDKAQAKESRIWVLGLKEDSTNNWAVLGELGLEHIENIKKYLLAYAESTPVKPFQQNDPFAEE